MNNIWYCSKGNNTRVRKIDLFWIVLGDDDLLQVSGQDGEL